MTYSHTHALTKLAGLGGMWCSHVHRGAGQGGGTSLVGPVLGGPLFIAPPKIIFMISYSFMLLLEALPHPSYTRVYIYDQVDGGRQNSSKESSVPHINANHPPAS